MLIASACIGPLAGVIPVSIGIHDDATAARVAVSKSTSKGPVRVLEVRRGTVGELWRGPKGTGLVPEDPDAARQRLARPAWLVVLVGQYPGFNCPLHGACPLQEGREEIVLDEQTGEGIETMVTAPAPGGIVPPPRDTPCGPNPCGP